MSFSKQVKEEISKLNNLFNKQDMRYEFLGYLVSANIYSDINIIKYYTENDYNIDRFAKVLRNNDIEDFEINISGKLFYIEIKNIFLEEIKKIEIVDLNIEQAKSFIRGVFMGAGSVNNPEKKYHLECNVREVKIAKCILELMNKFNFKLKQREKMIYIKEGEEISKFLAFIGATNAVLKFESIRVQRQMNNKVNRLVNCETANLNKVLNASVEQINAINLLKQLGKFECLDKNLKIIAELRLKYPDISLIELGKKLDNPIGKSGVNYRLKKIIEIANETK